MLRQSVCRWCFNMLPLETLAADASAIGLAGIDLVDPIDFPILMRHNLIGTMTPSHTISKGLNDPANHAECLAKIRSAIAAAAAAGFPNVICFSGDRNPGQSDEDGAKHCLAALRQILPYAEQKRITVHMELLNSKLDHPGYMCDSPFWAADIARALSSERFKILFDIYHMQVQHGDIIATIQQLAPYIGHYHTAGVPGRHEIDDTQELHYPAIIRTINATGFNGFLAHEFIPTRDPLASLKEAVAICTL
jgi:hydroxypyruvate isomerase